MFMAKNFKINNYAINLIELMHTLWIGKWKLAVAVAISLIVVISYQSMKIKNFTAKTQIKPISTLELIKFFEFNNMITNTGKITDTNTNTNTDTDTDTDTTAGDYSQ